MQFWTFVSVNIPSFTAPTRNSCPVVVVRYLYDKNQHGSPGDLSLLKVCRALSDQMKFRCSFTTVIEEHNGIKLYPRSNMRLVRAVQVYPHHSTAGTDHSNLRKGAGLSTKCGTLSS